MTLHTGQRSRSELVIHKGLGWKTKREKQEEKSPSITNTIIVFIIINNNNSNDVHCSCFFYHYAIIIIITIIIIIILITIIIIITLPPPLSASNCPKAKLTNFIPELSTFVSEWCPLTSPHRQSWISQKLLCHQRQHPSAIGISRSQHLTDLQQQFLL